MKPKGKDLRNEQIRAALLAIAARHDGLLSPAQIVEEARDPASPLHDEFEWDDDSAAEQYRMAQAGALVRRLKLTVIREDAKARNVQITTTRAVRLIGLAITRLSCAAVAHTHSAWQ